MLQFRDLNMVWTPHIYRQLYLCHLQMNFYSQRYSERTYIGFFAFTACVCYVFETIASTSYLSIDLI